MTSMTTVFFLRHGPTQENKDGRVQGQRPGTLLIPETERYIAGIVPLLREKQITVLLSSDLERAQQTRMILKSFLLLPNVKEGISPLLREKAMGFYEGMLWSEVPAGFREQRGKETFDFRTFGGENSSDVQQRVRYALREFAVRYPNARIACVTHAGWLQQLVLIADAEGILPDQWSDRSAIYEGGLGPVGQLRYFHPVSIEAQLVLRGDGE
jgi:broad specificity phosphatase PhoE